MGTTEFLGNVSLFKHLKEDALERLSSQLRLVYLPEGHMIRDTHRDTKPADGLYIIKSGVAKVTKPSQTWEAEAVLAILCKGDLTPLLVSEASRVQLPLQHTPLATCLSTSCGV